MKLKKNFWIRVLLLSVMALSLTVPGSWAATMTQPQQTQAIQSLESTLFAVRYDQETPEARVIRLEEVVFGQKQTGSMDARISRLKSALSPKALGPLSPNPKQENQAASAQPATGNQRQAMPSTPKAPVNTGNLPGQTAGQTTASQSSGTPAPNETDYPTISEMERKLFSKTYTNEDITTRLARLEKEVFKVPQTGTLAERSDNLRMVVLGDLGNGPPAIASYPAGGYVPAPGPAQSYTPPQYGNAYPSSGNGAYNGYGGNGGSYPGGTQVASHSPPSYYGQAGSYQPPSYSSGGGDYQASYQPGTNPGSMSSGQISPDMLAAMDEMEKQIIGHTYPSEPITARLDRLETKVFKTTSPELAPQERMQRVIAVASAGGAPSSPQSKAKTTFQTLLPIILTILPLLLL